MTFTPFEEECMADPVTGVTIWRQHLFTARGWRYCVHGEPQDDEVTGCEAT